MAMPVIVSAPGPLLSSVTLCGALLVLIVWLPNVRLEGDRLTTGSGVTPVPLRLTLCGLPLPLSVIAIAAVRAPAAAGVNVTVIVQPAFQSEEHTSELPSP